VLTRDAKALCGLRCRRALRLASGDLLSNDRFNIGGCTSKVDCQFLEDCPLGLVGSQPGDEIAILRICAELFQFFSQVFHARLLKEAEGDECSLADTGEKFNLSERREADLGRDPDMVSGPLTPRNSVHTSRTAR
jgi:hypothetical protein